MDWTAAYSCRVELTALNDDLTDAQAVEGVTGASVDFSIDGDAPTLATASVTLASDAPAPFGGWARIDAVCAQGGERVRVPLGCYGFEIQSARFGNGGYEVDMEGGSVLSPLDAYSMAAGSFAPYGADAAAWCAALMAQAGCPSRVLAEATAALGGAIVFGGSDTALDAVWQVLGACGLSIRVDGGGDVRIVAVPSEPALTIDRGDARGMRAELTVKGSELGYTREWADGVSVGDVVRVELPSLGVAGDYRVTSQGIDLAYGLAVEEELELVDG